MFSLPRAAAALLLILYWLGGCAAAVPAMPSREAPSAAAIENSATNPPAAPAAIVRGPVAPDESLHGYVVNCAMTAQGWPPRAPAPVSATAPAALTQPAPTTAPAETAGSEEIQPWFSATKLCVYPLGQVNTPTTPKELQQSLEEGWLRPFTPQPGASTITVEGDTLAKLRSLHIDLSYAQVNRGYRFPKLVGETAPEMVLELPRLQWRGAPLVSGLANLFVQGSADQVRLELKRDEAGQPYLVLAQARNGIFHCEISQEDLQKLALTVGKESARRHGISVSAVRLEVHSANEHNIRGDVRATIWLGLLPAKLHISGQLDIDDQLNGTLSGLRADGDDLLGWVIIGMLQPALRKLEGQTKPLAMFPATSLQLKDLRVKAGEKLQITAEFASP